MQLLKGMPTNPDSGKDEQVLGGLQMNLASEKGPIGGLA